MIRLVATDLDGTFWGRDLIAPDAHVAAVKELLRRGVTVLAATSRRPRVAKKHLGAAGLELPAVLIDGAVGIDFRTDVRFHEAVFQANDARQMLEAFRAHGLDPCLYVDDPEIDIAVSSTPSTCAEHLENLGPVLGTHDLDNAVASMPIYAFSVLGLDYEVLAPLALELAYENGASAVLYPEPVYGRFGLVVNPQGVSKWSGIEAYCTNHGIAPEEVAAVGDGLNDVSMLRHAGMRIGVKGGCDEIIDLADFLIPPPEKRGWERIPDLLEGSG
jgi:hydroxymethylpyrimidine pyrophosphatase-like HAD family hydrolase